MVDAVCDVESHSGWMTGWYRVKSSSSAPAPFVSIASTWGSLQLTRRHLSTSFWLSIASSYLWGRQKRRRRRKRKRRRRTRRKTRRKRKKRKRRAAAAVATAIATAAVMATSQKESFRKRKRRTMQLPFVHSWHWRLMAVVPLHIGFESTLRWFEYSWGAIFCTSQWHLTPIGSEPLRGCVMFRMLEIAACTHLSPVACLL